MSKNIFCPVCGSHDLTRSEERDSTQLTLGAEFTYVKETYSCKECGESGDFALSNDSRFLEAQKDAQAVSMKEMVESLSGERHISMAYVERAFELPVRTVTRWKTGDFSASSMALMRTIKTFPFIVEVAATGFDPAFARHQLCLAGARAFKASMGPDVETGYSCEMSEEREVHSFFISGKNANTKIRIGA